MPAGIEEFDIGFTTENTWHMHDNYTVTGAAITLDQVFDTFDFSIAPQPVYLADGTEVPGKAALVRTGGRADEVGPIPLSVMGASYVNHDYRSYFGRLHSALTSYGVTVVTVGSLGNGRKGFMSVELPEGYGDLDFPGWSKVHNVLNFGDSVDGSTTTTAAQAMNIVVCCNTFAAYLIGAPRLWRIAHRKNAADKVEQAIANLDMAMEQTKAIRDAVERLCNDPFTEADFAELLAHDDMMPAPDLEASSTLITRHNNIVDSVWSRYHGSDIDGIRTTKMGALMAIQGWEQHVRQVNGADKDNRTARNLRRTVFGEKTDTYTEVAAKVLVGI